METLSANELLNRTPLSTLHDARQQLNDGELPEALQTIDAAIIFSGSGPFYIYQKIRIMYDAGALESCSEFIETQLEQLYKHASLYILCRTLDYYQKINHLPLTEFRDFLHTHTIPTCLADHYVTLLTQKHLPFLQLAKKALVQDDYHLASSYCTLILKIDPNNKEALYINGYAYHMLRDLDKANFYYDSYLQHNLCDPHAYVMLGSVYLEQGVPTLAMDYFEKAACLDPTNKEYLSYVAECHLAHTNYLKALGVYQRIAKYYPNDIQNLFNLAFAYKKARKKCRSKFCVVKAKRQLKLRY